MEGWQSNELMHTWKPNCIFKLCSKSSGIFCTGYYAVKGDLTFVPAPRLPPPFLTPAEATPPVLGPRLQRSAWSPDFELVIH